MQKGKKEKANKGEYLEQAVFFSRRVALNYGWHHDDYFHSMMLP